LFFNPRPHNWCSAGDDRAIGRRARGSRARVQRRLMKTWQIKSPDRATPDRLSSGSQQKVAWRAGWHQPRCSCSTSRPGRRAAGRKGSTTSGKRVTAACSSSDVSAEILALRTGSSSCAAQNELTTMTDEESVSGSPPHQ
jgi:hypothetical protein